MKERLDILKVLKDEEDLSDKVIKSNINIYGACRHKPEFYRYKNHDPSTYEFRLAEEDGVAYREAWHLL